MDEQTGEAVVRQFHRFMRKADFESAGALLADDAVMLVSGRNVFSGCYEGREEVIRFYSTTRAVTNNTLKSQLHDVIGNDRHTVAIEHLRASCGDRELDSRDVTLFHVVEGRVERIVRLVANQYAHDEFWGPPH